MRVMKSFLIAVSMYSRIPVPGFTWKEEDMRYIFCFFPWIGAFIGGSIYSWDYLCGICQIGNPCRTAIGLAIPLLITGGIHADGFMDTMDAIHSYSSKERKLDILKDAHIGAFAVIRFAVYGLITYGAFSEIENDVLLKIVCSGFFLSRCLSGIGAVSFPLAKKDGMLFRFADSSGRKTVKISLVIQSAACIGLMFFLSFPFGMVVVSAALFSFLAYFGRSKKEFGGITGDTAGYFVLLCEGCMIAAAAVLNIWIGKGCR